MTLSKKNLLLIIAGLLLVLFVGYQSYQKKLLQVKTEALEVQKAIYQEQQIKSIDSLKVINNKLREKLVQEQNKPPVIIPRYNETIIYTSVTDSAIIGAHTKERQTYLQKRSR